MFKVWVIGAAMVFLTACGFQPLHGRQLSGTSATAAFSKISIPPIDDRLGQMLRIELSNRLTPKGPPRVAAYVLNVKVTESKQSLGVRKDATATRANLIISANFSLVETQAGRVLFDGSVRSINSYNILGADFATLSAESDARRRASRDLATEIQSRLGIFLSQPTQN